MYQLAANLSDTHLTVSFNGAWLQIAVSPDGETLQVVASEEIDWRDKLSKKSPQITMSGRRVKAASSSSRSSSKSSSVSTTRVRNRSRSMGADRRDEIVAAFNANPDASSREVARQVFGRASRENIQRVAGVKSSFTKGLYSNA